MGSSDAALAVLARAILTTAWQPGLGCLLELFQCDVMPVILGFLSFADLWTLSFICSRARRTVRGDQLWCARLRLPAPWSAAEALAAFAPYLVRMGRLPPPTPEQIRVAVLSLEAWHSWYKRWGWPRAAGQGPLLDEDKRLYFAVILTPMVQPDAKPDWLPMQTFANTSIGLCCNRFLVRFLGFWTESERERLQMNISTGGFELPPQIADGSLSVVSLSWDYQLSRCSFQAMARTLVRQCSLVYGHGLESDYHGGCSPGRV